jgi:hypothetical protein
MGARLNVPSVKFFSSETLNEVMVESLQSTADMD